MQIVVVKQTQTRNGDKKINRSVTGNDRPQPKTTGRGTTNSGSRKHVLAHFTCAFFFVSSIAVVAFNKRCFIIVDT